MDVLGEGLTGTLEMSSTVIFKIASQRLEGKEKLHFISWRTVRGREREIER